MEDPTFSDTISFIWLSDTLSGFILCTNNRSSPEERPQSLPQEKIWKTLTPQLQHKKWWEQNWCHTIKKCDLVPYIHTQLCRLAEEQNTVTLVLNYLKFLHPFRGKKKKKVLICLKYELSLQLKKEKKINPKKPSTTGQIFSGTNFLHTINQSKWEGESRSEEDPQHLNY